MHFLLFFKGCKVGSHHRRFLLTVRKLVLRRCKIRSRGFEQLLMTVAFIFKSHESSLSLCQFGLGGGAADQQFGAALFVVANAGSSAITFNRNFVKSFAILAGLGL